MLQTRAETFAQLGGDLETFFLLFPRNRDFVTGKSDMPAFGGPGVITVSLSVVFLIFGVIGVFRFVNAPNDYRTGGYVGFAIICGVTCLFQWGRKWYQRQQLAKLLHTARFFKGQLVSYSGKLISSGNGKSYGRYELTVVCQFQQPNGLPKTLSATNRNSQYNKLLKQLVNQGEPMIVMILDKPLHLTGTLQRKYIL